MSNFPPVCYEIFVRSFCDSNGDGIGDLNGITSRLDYLFDLGIRGIWLTPIQPSPSYHKYDTTDYYGIDPEYGSLEDYRRLLDEAHRRGMQVYMDLVIHHTSIQHEWFVAAKHSVDSPYRNYFRWMSEKQINELGLEVREQTQDAHTVNPWHKVKGEKERYLGVFSREMADLDFDNEAVRSEIFKVADFWLNEIGVDGFRLDAARHIYPDWEADRNPAFWIDFSERIEAMKPNAFLVGEVWAETERVAPFFKGLKANFNFDLWLKIERLLTERKNLGLAYWLQEQRSRFGEVREDFIDAIMLSNHDQKRIGSTLNGNKAQMKLAAAILLTLPGQPYLYYGEEIGMLGEKPDIFLREPFLWGDEALETRWKRPKFSKPGKVRSLNEALCDPNSLYYCYKHLIRLRNRFQEIGAVNRTGIEAMDGTPDQILAYVRRGERVAFLILHNLSDEWQQLTLGGEWVGNATIRWATTTAFGVDSGDVKLGAYNSLILEFLRNE